MIFDGYTPYLAAFWGITCCILVGLMRSTGAPADRRDRAGRGLGLLLSSAAVLPGIDDWFNEITFACRAARIALWR